jgi:hypothetical protein
MSVQALKRALLGSPISTSHDRLERLGRATGLAVFASDALSSVLPSLVAGAALLIDWR